MCRWGTEKRILIEGRNVSVDSCIAELILKLNRKGIKTIASCCGHGKSSLRILFELDGEVYQITKHNLEDVEKIIW